MDVLVLILILILILILFLVFHLLFLLWIARAGVWGGTEARTEASRSTAPPAACGGLGIEKFEKAGHARVF